MLKEREQTFSGLMAVWDVILTVLSLGISMAVRGVSFDQMHREYQTLAVIIILLWFILLRAFNLARIHRFKAYSILFLEYMAMVTVGMGLLFLSIFLLKLDVVSRLVLVLFGGINLAALFLSKVMQISAFKYYRKKGYNIRNVVVIADDTSDDFIKKVLRNTEWGYKLVGIITNSDKIRVKYKDYRIYPENTLVWTLLEEETIDELIYARKGFDNEEIKQLIFACEEIGVTFRVRSQLFTMVATKAHLNYFEEIPFLTFTNTPTDYLALLFKSLFDKAFAVFVLLLVGPIMLLIALWIKLDSKGPVFFIQKRVGLRGRIFGVYKFRTMVTNAEELKEKLMAQNEQEGPVFKMKNDPRITRAGRFLRKTSLDELPQFLNVLFGDMSVVGPRPPVPKEVAEYERWQLRRLSMRPGITCIWQVSGRNEISFEDWMKLDLQYIDSWSLKLDMILILKTVKVVLKADGH